MQKNPSVRSDIRSGLTVSLVSFAVNLTLAILKLVCGILGNAPSLVSDAAHSASDLFSTSVLLIGLRLSAKAPDEKHPYGHERFECLASIMLSGILLVTGFAIGITAARSILSGVYLTVTPPRAIAVAVAIVSIIGKLSLSRYMRKKAKSISSTALRAESLHQISDALASLFALVGIILSIIGLPLFEPLASILIAGFLINASIGIFREASEGILDRSAGSEIEELLITAIEELDSTVSVSKIATRLFGSRIYAEIELSLDESLSLAECEKLVSRMKAEILVTLPELKGCTVAASPRKNP